MKDVMGGLEEATNCGSSGAGGCCNVYCGTGTNVTCTGTCGACEPAGNGSGSEKGQDKLCA